MFSRYRDFLFFTKFHAHAVNCVRLKNRPRNFSVNCVYGLACSNDFANLYIHRVMNCTSGHVWTGQLPIKFAQL